MPIYEYRCTDCNARFEELVRVSCAADERCAPPCPSCASPRTHRLVSAASIRSGTAGGGSMGGFGSGGGVGGAKGGCGPSGGFT